MSSHYNDVTMSAITSQITSLAIVYSTVYLGSDQRKHQSSVSLAFVRGIHRVPVNSPHKGPVTRKMFPFDDVIMWKIAANLFRARCVTCLIYFRHNHYAVFMFNMSLNRLNRRIWFSASCKITTYPCHTNQYDSMHHSMYDVRASICMIYINVDK